MKYIESQFSNPRGIIGHLVGIIMAYENRARNQWALSLMDIQPTDRILEIGFGPGWAIQQASKLAYQGLVAGVDSSGTMMQQAYIRNRTVLKSESVVLRQGNVSQIPFDDWMFSKVYTVNSFHEWNDSEHGVKEASRVLKSGGTFLIVEHPHGNVTMENIKKIGEGINLQLTEQGFEFIQVMYNSFHGRWAVGIKGVKA